MNFLILTQCILLYGTFSTLGKTVGKKDTKWISQCFNVKTGQPLITMACDQPPGTAMILMKDAFHGKATNRHWATFDSSKCYKADGVDSKCIYCPEDCIDDSLTMAYDWTKCTGSSNCTHYVMQTNMPKCPKQYSDYLYLEYVCIPKANVFDVCSQPERWVRDGYISSPNYPNHYQPSQACKCSLEASWGESGVEFQIYELLLEQNKDKECQDWLLIKNSKTKMRHCGQIFNTTMKVPGRVVDIYFYTDSNDVSTQMFQYFTRTLKGFWLYFKVVSSNMKISCGRLPPEDPGLMEVTVPPTTSRSTQPTTHATNNSRGHKPTCLDGGRSCRHKGKSNDPKSTAKRNSVNSADFKSLNLAFNSAVSTILLLLLTLL